MVEKTSSFCGQINEVGIFFGSHLYFHGAEFDSPGNVWVDVGRRFETDWVPIRWLNAFEKSSVELSFLQLFVENNEAVTSEEIIEMLHQVIVDFYIEFGPRVSEITVGQWWTVWFLGRGNSQDHYTLSWRTYSHPQQ